VRQVAWQLSQKPVEALSALAVSVQEQVPGAVFSEETGEASLHSVQKVAEPEQFLHLALQAWQALAAALKNWPTGHRHSPMLLLMLVMTVPALHSVHW
jgi:NifU-like protein involved in Fe-S cluster formation